MLSGRWTVCCTVVGALVGHSAVAGKVDGGCCALLHYWGGERRERESCREAELCGEPHGDELRTR